MPPRPGTALAGADPQVAAAPAQGVTIEPLADGESGKVARLGIRRDDNLMYYIAKGDVWAMPRKTPGSPGGKPFVVAKAGIAMDFEKYLYYLDADGDISRKSRAR